MTRLRLELLARLLLELREWLTENDPDTLDRALVQETYNVCVRESIALMMAGER